MNAKLIQIGNSKGIRLPKSLIEKYELSEELEILETDEGIIIKPVSSVRSGWEEQFKSANAENTLDDDFSGFMNLSSEFDEKEWTW